MGKKNVALCVPTKFFLLQYKQKAKEYISVPVINNLNAMSKSNGAIVVIRKHNLFGAIMTSETSK